MSFKENLLKKIRINELAGKVAASVGTPGSDKKIDRESMRKVFDMGPFTYHKERDLDLYIPDTGADTGKVIVLDGELAIYETTIEDVAMRKSPTIKEMLNIRNVFRILNDKDVVVSRRTESVERIRQKCIDQLDLSFQVTDLEEIENDGAASLQREYADGVLEALSLFADLLEYVLAPKAFKISNFRIIGKTQQKESGEMSFGPMVLYSMIYNTLKLIDAQISPSDREKIEFMHQVAKGKEKPSAEGSDVFTYLKESIIKACIPNAR